MRGKIPELKIGSTLELGDVWQSHKAQIEKFKDSF